MEPDNGGNIHRPGHDGGMGGLASLLGRKAEDECAVDGGCVGRGEIARHDDVRLVLRGNRVGRLSEEVPDDAACNVLDVHDTFAQVRIVDGPECAAILLRDLVESVFHVVAFVFEVAENFIDKRAVFDHEKMGVEDAGILRANRIRNTLLDFKKLGPGGNEGGLEARDLFGKFASGDRSNGDFFVVQPVHSDPGMGDAGRYGNSLKTNFLRALGITSTHAARRNRFFSGLKCEKAVYQRKTAARPLLFAKTGLNKIFDLRDHFVGVHPFCDEVELGSFSRREHHQAHDTLAIDALTVLFDPNLCAEAARGCLTNIAAGRACRPLRFWITISFVQRRTSSVVDFFPEKRPII